MNYCDNGEKEEWFNEFSIEWIIELNDKYITVYLRRNWDSIGDNRFKSIEESLLNTEESIVLLNEMREILKTLEI